MGVFGLVWFLNLQCSQKSENLSPVGVLLADLLVSIFLSKFSLDGTCLATPQSCIAQLGVVFQPKGHHEKLSSWESLYCAEVLCTALQQFKQVQLSPELTHHKFI